MKKLIALFAGVLFLVSCGKDEESSLVSNDPTQSNALTGTYAGVSSQTEKIGGLAPSSSSLNSQANRTYRSMAATAFGNDWHTNQVMPDDTTADNNDMIPVKGWMGQQISASAVRANGSSISVFGRMNDTLGVFCAIGVALGTNVDGNGYPEDGTTAVTITSAMVSTIDTYCDFDASDASGMTLSFTTTTPSDTSVYAKRVELTPPGTNGTQVVYFKKSNTAVNVASVETYTHNSENYISRTVIEVDVTNQELRAEYISGHNNGTLSNGERIEFSRILYDESNDKGYVMSMAYEKDTTSTTTEWVLTGKPETDGSEFALSFISDTFLSDGNERQMCVDSDTGDNAGTDGTYCGDVAGVSIAGQSVSNATVFTNLKSGYDSANYDTISETTDLAFTSSNFLTTAFATE